MISQKHDHTDNSQTLSNGGSASRATGGSVTISGGVLMAVIAAFCGMAMMAAVWAAFTARDAETEARMVEYYLMDPHYRTPEELAAWSKFRQEHQ